MHSTRVSTKLSSLISSRIAGDAVDPRAGVKAAAALLGANLVETWICKFGVADASAGVAQSWTGQQLGMVVAAANSGERPTHNANGTITTASSGTRLDQATNQSPVVLGATDPVYTCSVARRTTGNAGSLFTLTWQNNTQPIWELDCSDASTLRLTWQNYSGNRVTTTWSDTSAFHILETWIDGSSKMNLRVDGGSVIQGPVDHPYITYPIGRVTVGARCTDRNNWGDFEHAAHIIAKAYPGDTNAAALRAALQADLKGIAF